MRIMKRIDDYSVEELEQLIATKKKNADKPIKKIPWTSPVDIWEVTTEGDCEGRTTKKLGTHTGHIVDIAQRLGGHASYGLRFTRMTETKLPSKPVKQVNIQLNVDSYTWNEFGEERVKMVREFLNREPSDITKYDVVESNYYACSLLVF